MDKKPDYLENLRREIAEKFEQARMLETGAEKPRAGCHFEDQIGAIPRPSLNYSLTTALLVFTALVVPPLLAWSFSSPPITNFGGCGRPLW